MATTANRKTTALKEAMTKSQILDVLSESTGLQRKDVASVLDQLGVVIERHGVPHITAAKGQVNGNRWRVLRRALLGFAIAGISAFMFGCSTTPGNLRFIDESSSFPGIESILNESSDELAILTIHGMCHHHDGTVDPEKNWVRERARWIARVLGAVPPTEPRERINHLPGKDGVTVQRFDVSLNHEATSVSKKVRVYGIVYSKPGLTKKQDTFCADMSGQYYVDLGCQDHERSTEYTEYPFQDERARLNSYLKENRMNSCFSDVTMYLQSGIESSPAESIRRGVRDAINEVLKELRSESGNERVNIPMVFLTYSLGSKVLNDAIAILRESTDGTDGELFDGQLKAIFMLGNQLPLLNLGYIPQASSTSIRPPTGAPALQLLAPLQFLGIVAAENADAPAPIVAFTDPNDVLSYEIRPRDVRLNHSSADNPVVNVSIPHAKKTRLWALEPFFWLGVLPEKVSFITEYADPFVAHDYESSEDVKQLIRCGAREGASRYDRRSRKCTRVD